MAVSRYVSQFKKAKQEESAKPVIERKPIIREKKEEVAPAKSQIVEKLSKINDLTARFKEAEVSIEVVDKTVDEINTIIKDVIDEVGSTNPVINTLINAAAEVEEIPAEPVAVEETPTMAIEEYPSLDNALEDEIDLSAEVAPQPEMEIAPEMETEMEPEIDVEDELGMDEAPAAYNYGETIPIDDEMGIEEEEEEKEEKEEE